MLRGGITQLATENVQWTLIFLPPHPPPKRPLWHHTKRLFYSLLFWLLCAEFKSHLATNENVHGNYPHTHKRPLDVFRGKLSMDATPKHLLPFVLAIQKSSILQQPKFTSYMVVRNFWHQVAGLHTRTSSCTV